MIIKYIYVSENDTTTKPITKPAEPVTKPVNPTDPIRRDSPSEDPAPKAINI